MAHTPDSGLLFWLAHVVRHARRTGTKRRAHYAVATDLDASSLTRFEQAEGWPRNPDQVVNGYAEVLGLEAPELWRRAIALWEAHLAGELDVDDDLDVDEVSRALERFAREVGGAERPRARRRAAGS